MVLNMRSCALEMIVETKLCYILRQAPHNTTHIMRTRKAVCGHDGPSGILSQRPSSEDIDSLRDSQTKQTQQKATPNERLRQAIVLLAERPVNSNGQLEERLDLTEEYILRRYPEERLTFDPRLYNQVKAMVEQHKGGITTEK